MRFRRRPRFYQYILVYLVSASMVLAPCTPAFADGDHVEPTPGPEAPARVGAGGPECSAGAWDRAIEETPLIFFSRGYHMVPKTISTRRGSRQSATQKVRRYGDWYFYVPYGYDHKTGNGDPDTKDTHGYQGTETYPHYRLQFDKLLARALSCMAGADPKAESLPKFVEKLKHHLEFEVPDRLATVKNGKGQSFHRKYNKVLHEQIEAFERLRAVLNVTVSQTAGQTLLSHAISKQLEDRHNKLKKNEFPLVVSEMEEALLKLHKLLEDNPGFTADRFEGENKALYNLLFGTPPHADVLFGFPLAAQMRDLAIRGKAAKGKAPPYSFMPKDDNFIYNSFPEGSSQLAVLKKWLKAPAGTELRYRYGMTHPWSKASPYYWLNGEEDAQAEVSKMFTELSSSDRARVRTWLAGRMEELNAAKGYGDHGTHPSTAMHREVMMKARRELENIDGGDAVPEMEEFDYARSEHYRSEFEKEPANRQLTNRWDGVQARYKALTGDTLPNHTAWRYYNLHPSYKRMLDQILARAEGDKKRYLDQVKRVMKDLSHTSIMDELDRGFDSSLLFDGLASMINEAGISDEDFKKATGVDLSALKTVLAEHRSPYFPWYRKFSAVMGVGDAYKGEKVREFLLQQILARKFVENINEMTKPQEGVGLGESVLRWFNLGNKEPMTPDQRAQAQRAAVVNLLGEVKRFYAEGKDKGLDEGALEGKLKAIVHRAGVQADKRLVSYLMMAGRNTQNLLDKPAESSYWSTNEVGFGALATLLQNLDEIAHKKENVETVYQGSDRYNPDAILMNLSSESNTKAQVIRELASRGLIPEGKDARDHLAEEFEKLRERVMRDPREWSDRTGYTKLIHRGVPAASRATLLKLLLPENHSHVDMLERLGDGIRHREEATFDNRDEVPKGLYEILAMGGEPAGIEAGMATLDPKGHHHFACFERPEQLRRDIINSLVKNEGALAPQAMRNLEFLAATMLYMEERGQCEVFDDQEVVSQFYVPNGNTMVPSGLLISKVQELRQMLGMLAADQARRKVKSAFSTPLEGDGPFNDEELESYVVHDLVENDGQLSKGGEATLGELAASKLGIELGLFGLHRRKKLPNGKYEFAFDPPANIRAKMNEILVGLKKKASETDSEELARAIMTKTALAREGVSGHVNTQFLNAHPNHAEMSAEEKQAAWKKFINEYIKGAEWTQFLTAEMANVEDIERISRVLHEHLPEYRRKLTHEFHEIDEKGSGAEMFEDFIGTAFSRRRQKAFSQSAQANREYRDLMAQIGPNPETNASEILRRRRERDKKAKAFLEANQLTQTLQLFRSQVFEGDPSMSLALRHLEERGRKIRELVPTRAGGEGDITPSLGAEMVNRVYDFLESIKVDVDDRSLIGELTEQTRQSALTCAFGRDENARENSCSYLGLVLEHFSGGQEKAKIAKWVADLQTEGRKRVMDTMVKEGKEYVKRLEAVVGPFSDRERGQMEHLAFEYIYDIDSRLQRRDEEQADQWQLAEKLVDEHLAERFAEVQDPAQKEAVRGQLVNNVRFLLNDAGFDLAKLESLANTSFLPFAQRGLDDRNKPFGRLLRGAEEDWTGESPILSREGSDGMKETYEGFLARAKRDHDQDRAKREKAVKALTAVGFKFDGVAVTLNDNEFAWRGLMSRSSRALKLGGWADLSPSNQWGRRFNDRQARAERLKEMEFHLDQLDELGIPVHFDMGRPPIAGAPTSYDGLMDRLMNTNYGNLMTHSEWNPMSGNLASRISFNEHTGQVEDVNFESIPMLKLRHEAAKANAEHHYERYKDSIENYESFGSTLSHFASNLGNYWSEWENPRAIAMNNAWSSYSKHREMLDGYGGILVDEENGLMGKAVYAQELHKAKGILIREAGAIQKVMGDIEMINEIGWTVIITVGTMGVGAYLTTVANAARLMQAGRVVVQGGRLVAVGNRTMRVGRAGIWAARALNAGRLGRMNSAVRILNGVNRVRTAGVQGMYGVGFTMVPMEIMNYMENQEVQGLMDQAMRDYDEGKFKPGDEEYRKKYKDLWAIIDSDQDGIPDWHEDDDDKEWEYLHPSLSQSWDMGAKGFTFFAGMTLAGPLKVPFLPRGLQGLNQRVFAPTIHVASGSLATDLAFDVRRGNKGVNEAIVDAGLTGVILAPAAAVATSPLFHKLPGAQRFFNVGKTRVTAGRLYGAGATALTMGGGHKLGEPLKMDFKEMLGFDVEAQREAMEAHEKNKGMGAMAAEWGQHALFAWMMSHGGQIRHIQNSMKKPGANIAQLKETYTPKEVEMALAMMPRYEVQTGYEPPKGQPATTSSIVTADGRAKARQPTTNEPLLRELATREGMDVDTYAFGLAMVKTGIQPKHVEFMFPGNIIKLPEGVKPPTWLERRNGEFQSVLHGWNSIPMRLPGTTTREVPSRIPGRGTTTKEGPTYVRDNGHSDVADMVGRYYRRMWELARDPVAHGAPKEAMTAETQAKLADYQKYVAAKISENPSLLGLFRPKADDIANPIMADALHRFGTFRMASDMAALRGKPAPPEASVMGGELFAAYVVQARREPGTKDQSLDFMMNQFQLKAGRGEVKITEADWVAYEATYGRPRPAWAPQPPTPPSRIPARAPVPRIGNGQ